MGTWQSKMHHSFVNAVVGKKKNSCDMFVFWVFLFLKPQSIKQAFLHWYLFTSTNNRLYFGIWTLQCAPLQWRPSGILPRPPPRICQRVRPWPIGSPQAVESFQKTSWKLATEEVTDGLSVQTCAWTDLKDNMTILQLPLACNLGGNGFASPGASNCAALIWCRL